MWKRIGLGSIMLLALSGGLIFIDGSLIDTSSAAIRETNSGSSMTSTNNRRRRHRRRHQRRHRRGRRG